MQKKDPINSLNEIKSMMQRSSKFTSISGWSGVWVGFVGMISATIAYFGIVKESFLYEGYQDFMNFYLMKIKLIILSLVTLIVALLGGFYFMMKKSNQDHIKFINPITKRILKKFAFILIIGGIVSFIFIKNLNLAYFAPSTLLFYGLALYTVERDTIVEIKYLAFCEIILGLLAFYYIYNGLLFWFLGFGVLHVIVGICIVKKYGNKD